MQTKTIIANSVEELRSSIDKEFTVSFEPTLAICFSSSIHELKDISKIFKSRDIKLFGATSAGEICDDEVSQNSISVILFDLNVDYFSVLSNSYSETESVYQTCFEIGAKARMKFTNPAIITLSSQMGIDGQRIVDGLCDGSGTTDSVYGGLSGNDQDQNKTWVFDENDISSNGIMVLAIDQDKVEVKGKATSGWEPIGIPHTITEAEGNVVKSINGRPALDVFINYFGSFEGVNSQELNKTIKTISGQYPFQIEKGGYRILRSPLVAILEERSLVLGGSISEGERFRFSSSPGLEVIENTIKEYKDFSSEAPEADALIMFSCVGRNAAFGPMMEEEIKGVRNIWNVPMAGFFTFGEIGKTATGKSDFHNITCSLISLKAK